MHEICMRLLKRVKWRILGGLLSISLFLIAGSIFFINVARTAPTPPGISTPTKFFVTLNKAELQTIPDGDFKTLISDTPATRDVIGNTGKTTDTAAWFTSGAVNMITYNGIRLTLASVATFDGVNPCTGDPVTDFPVQLFGAVNGQYVMQYQVPHPIRGIPPEAIEYQPFKITAENKTTPMEFRIVFPVSNSLACVSDSAPAQAISGTDTGANTPYSLYIDSLNSEIGVTNNGANSVTVYRSTDRGNILPLRTIQGADTGLDAPWGIGVYYDPNPPANVPPKDEIVVANSGNDSITVYNRTDGGDATPIRTIQTVKDNTGTVLFDSELDGPGGIYVDAVHSEIGVANGGSSDSITIYDRLADINDTSNHAPIPRYTIQGSSTGLSTPCGIYYDSVKDEIVVGNNGNNSITVYQHSQLVPGANNFAPESTIKGSNTGLSKVCSVFVDTNTSHNEIGVTNSGKNSITFYDRSASGNVYPVRTITGADTGLSSPVGAYFDKSLDELGVTNVADNSLVIYNRKSTDATVNPYGAVPAPLRSPVLINPTIQQLLYTSNVFSGNISRVTGEVLPNNEAISYDPIIYDSTNHPEGLSVPRYRGYGIDWKVTDSALRQANDATNAALIPPSAVTFTLADGTSASNLQVGCAAFTPFIIDTLTTACKTQPLIISPSPPVDSIYRVGAELFAKTIVQKLPLHISPLSVAEWPRLVPTVTLTANNSILDISWKYVWPIAQSDGTPMEDPHRYIYDQSVSINSADSYGQISSCYVQVGGNAQTLIYASGTLPPDTTHVSNVKNNNCDIKLSDVAVITFTTSDAYGNKYVYQWNAI